MKLKTYGGESIKVRGKLALPVTYEHQTQTLPLYVVAGSKQALFGRNWLDKIKMNWPQIFKTDIVGVFKISPHVSQPAKDMAGLKEQYKNSIL